MQQPLWWPKSHIYPQIVYKVQQKKTNTSVEEKKLNKWWKAKLTHKVQVQTVKNYGKINES